MLNCVERLRGNRTYIIADDLVFRAGCRDQRNWCYRRRGLPCASARSFVRFRFRYCKDRGIRGLHYAGMAAGKADAAAAPGSVRLSLPMSSSRRTFIKHLPFLYSLPGTLAAAPKSGLLEQRLLASFERLEMADTHEHFFDDRDRISQHVDFFTLAQGYTMSDLVSAGLSTESSRLIRNEQAPEMERWQAFEKYWKYTRDTGYGQALTLAAHDLD